MKAIQIEGYGNNDVIKLVDIPKPIVTPGHVLVEVYAASVNPVDWKIREGMLKHIMPLNFPVTLGGDFSGKVVEIGSNVSNVSPGDSVYGLANIGRGGSGSFAEFASVDATMLASKPKHVNYPEAAALPMTGLRAWLVTSKYLQLTSGKKILIHGGAGGIGIFAIQMSKHLGAYVATTCSASDIAFVKSLGANEALDYKNIPFEEVLYNYDAVFDTIGGETFYKSLKVLRKGGKITSMLARPDSSLIEEYEVQFIEQGRDIGSEAFQELTRLVDEGIVKVYIDKVYPLEKAADALLCQQKGGLRGKIVVSINKNF